MSAAREALEQQGSPMLLIGVTVLTRMDEYDLLEIGIQRSHSAQE